MADKLRADLALVRQGLAPSREKAQALIMAGSVYCKEVKIIKASEKVEEGEELTVRGHVHPFVGRGALKLDKALHVFHADVKGATAMDIGAATGGFTDVLLKNGAAHVYAIDVGYGQLDWSIRNDERVTVMERTNARYLTHREIPCTPDITVMDVSFISVKLILPVAAALMQQWSRDRGLSPYINGNQIRQYFIRGADRENSRRYPDRYYGFGTLNLRKTFESLRNL